MTFPGSLYAMAELFRLLFKAEERNKHKKIPRVKVLLLINFFRKYLFSFFLIYKKKTQKNTLDNVDAMLSVRGHFKIKHKFL